MHLRARACIVKTAQLKASSEEGKFSGAYKQDGAAVLVHPDDLAAWGFNEGMHVTCSNPETARQAVLSVKQTRNAKKGMVNIVLSPWTACLAKHGQRFVELDLEPTNATVTGIEDLLARKRQDVP